MVCQGKLGTRRDVLRALGTRRHDAVCTFKDRLSFCRENIFEQETKQRGPRGKVPQTGCLQTAERYSRALEFIRQFCIFASC